MRISTGQIYDRGVAAIATQQAALSRTQQQIALGKRIGTPSDDPVGAAQSVTLTQAKDRVAQYASNIDAAKDALAQNDTALGQVGDLLQSVRTLALGANSSALNDSDRATLATEISGKLQELVGLANQKDGDGHYLFAGFASATMPFSTAWTGSVAYNGDQGSRTLEVAPGRSLAIGYSGADVFEQVRAGNGAFEAAPATGNAGTGVLGGWTVTNPALLPGDSYRLQFTVTGGVTTYDVLDATTNVTVSTGNPYVTGAAIGVGGMQVAVSGAPANGDAFDLAPSGAQSMFQMLQSLVATLNTPASGAGPTARLQNGLNASLQGIDQALDHVLTLRADAGASLRELDSLTTGNEDRSLQIDQTMTRLVDLDYNKALSDYARQELSLEAAQKSFGKVTSLSLFDYL